MTTLEYRSVVVDCSQALVGNIDICNEQCALILSIESTSLNHIGKAQHIGISTDEEHLACGLELDSRELTNLTREKSNLATCVEGAGANITVVSNDVNLETAIRTVRNSNVENRALLGKVELIVVEVVENSRRCALTSLERCGLRIVLVETAAVYIKYTCDRFCLDSRNRDILQINCLTCLSLHLEAKNCREVVHLHIRETIGPSVHWSCTLCKSTLCVVLIRSKHNWIQTATTINRYILTRIWVDDVVRNSRAQREIEDCRRLVVLVDGDLGCWLAIYGKNIRFTPKDRILTIHLIAQFGTSRCWKRHLQRLQLTTSIGCPRYNRRQILGLILHARVSCEQNYRHQKFSKIFHANSFFVKICLTKNYFVLVYVVFVRFRFFILACRLLPYVCTMHARM